METVKLFISKRGLYAGSSSARSGSAIGYVGQSVRRLDWRGGGFSSLGAMRAYSAFYHSLDEAHQKKFEAFLQASEFWAGSQLGINTITANDVRLMQFLEGKLFPMAFPEGGQGDSISEQMGKELLMDIRAVRQQWEKLQREKPGATR